MYYYMYCIVIILCNKDWEERLRAEGEKGIKGWDDLMALPMKWIWTWANSGRWWRKLRPGMLQSMGSQSVGHNLATEQQQV